MSEHLLLQGNPFTHITIISYTAALCKENIWLLLAQNLLVLPTGWYSIHKPMHTGEDNPAASAPAKCLGGAVLNAG